MIIKERYTAVDLRETEYPNASSPFQATFAQCSETVAFRAMYPVSVPSSAHGSDEPRLGSGNVCDRSAKVYATSWGTSAPSVVHRAREENGSTEVG